MSADRRSADRDGTTAEVFLAEAAAVPIGGWDFSWLGSRMTNEPPPWDYDALVSAHADGSPDLLDLGTGGGEWRAALRCRPARVVATEGYEQNVPLASARLEPLGVALVRADAPDNVDQEPGATEPRLPFDDQSFSLVVSDRLPVCGRGGDGRHRELLACCSEHSRARADRIGNAAGLHSADVPPSWSLPGAGSLVPRPPCADRA